jgi:outer membrane receptor protein involved in Fe transport
VRVFAFAIALSLFVGLAAAAEAPASRGRAPTNLPAQDLGSALRSLALQRKFEIVFASREVASLRTQGAVGELSVDEALASILSGTGLTFVHLDDGTVMITGQGTEAAGKSNLPDRSPQSTDPEVVAGSGSGARGSPVEATSADSPRSPSTREANASRKSLFGRMGRLFAALSASASARAAVPEQGIELQEVTVTGSRVITNGNDSPNPVTVVTLQDLQASDPATVFEALEDLPQFSAGRGGSLGGGTGQGGNNNSIAALNLRALGSLRGLVLFDGHRIPPQNLDGQVDINQIPQMLLQRVEVQTGGGSAVYGSDAITGVVNFITDRKFTGIKVTAQYGLSERDDDRSKEFGVAAGSELFGGRGHIEGSVQSHEDAGLRRNQRSYIQSPATSFWTLAGNGSANAPYFLTQDARDGSISTGGKIVGPATAAGLANPLLNTNFTGNGVLSPFVNGSTAGLTGNSQIGGQGGLFMQNVTLKAPTGFVQLFGRFDVDLTDQVHYFMSGYYHLEHQFSTLTNLRSNASATSALGNGFVMGVDNAFLSAGYANLLKAAGFTTFNVGKIWDASLYPVNSYDYHNHDVYVNTGFEGKLGADWRWETSVTRSQEVQANTANNTWSTGRLFAALDAVVNPANGQVVCRVSLTVNAGLYPGCVPMNIFGPSATTMDMWNYVQMPTRYVGTTDLSSVEGSISAAPVRTWAGPVNMVLSAEWRRLSYLLLSGGEPANVLPLDCAGLRFNCVAPSATNIGTSQTYTAGTAGTPLRKPVTQTVTETALEADVPVLQGARFARNVDLQLAARHAGYSSSGTPASTIPFTTVPFSADTWKVGLDWHFDDEFTLRSTRSRDFRAPNLSDLFLPGRVQGFTLSQDRLTGANNVLAQQQVGGNPALKPEVGYTTTLGFVFKPSESFSLAIDAYDISITDAIATVDGSNVNYQDACYASGGASVFCSLQVRPLNSFTNTSSANTATYWYTAQSINIAAIRTQGVDIENNVRLDVLGHVLQLRTLVAYQPHLWTIQPLSITTDAGGVASPRLRALLSARFSLTDRFMVDWTTRWRSGLRNVDPRTVNNAVLPGSADVVSATFSNFTLTYHVGELLGGKLDAYMNVLNAFNQVPPVYAPLGNGTALGPTAGGSGVSYYSGDDAVGRYYNLGIRLRR